VSSIGNGYGYGPLLGLAAVAYLLGLAWVRWLLPKGLSTEPALAGGDELHATGAHRTDKLRWTCPVPTLLKGEIAAVA
jgi:hypothetical protein